MSALWFGHARFTVIHTADDRQRYLNYVSSCVRIVPPGGQIECTRLIRETSIALVLLIALGFVQPVSRFLFMVHIGWYMGDWLQQTDFSSAVTHQNE
jgi:hypothetical protein